jgi:hypothetical protein
MLVRVSLLVILSAVLAFGCKASPTSPSPPPEPPVNTNPPTPPPEPPPAAPPEPPPNPVPPHSDQSLIVVADIAQRFGPTENDPCRPEAELTARLVDGMPGTLTLAGDLAYEKGSARDFAQCFDPTYGRHKHRSLPAPGNHEYETPGAAGYYQYWGTTAGPGYYAVDRGAWRIYSINSQVRTQEQEVWLKDDLFEHRNRKCVAAFWHHPLFTSGQNGNNPQMGRIWDILYEGNADLVLAGHDHLYERFAPQTSLGQLDLAKGLRQFIVGTGGASLYNVVRNQPNSEVVIKAHGVARFLLRESSYSWEFIDIDRRTRDSGSADCH